MRTWFFQVTTGTGSHPDWTRFDNVLELARKNNVLVLPVLANTWRDCEASTVKIKFTANTTNGSTTLSTVSSFTNLHVGYKLSGTGIPSGTRIASLNAGSSQVTMTNAATATGTGTSVTVGYDQRTNSFYTSGNTADGYDTVVDGTWDKTTYRQYVDDITKRYANNDTIAFWQLMNEAQVPNDSESGCPSRAANTLQAFTTDVGGLAHTNDSNHLVDLGAQGTLQCATGSDGSGSDDYSTVHSSSGTDMCSSHDYGAASTATPTTLANAESDCSKSTVGNKPMIVDEVGINLGTEAGGNQTTREGYFDAKQKAAYTNGVDLWMPWAYCPGTSRGFCVGDGDSPIDPEWSSLKGN
jgi:Cellulase (glycosyl hydrolase family 5)